MSLDQRMERIESFLALLVRCERVNDWYSVEEFSQLVGRSQFTCRQWCRLGRIHAIKKVSGRGAHLGWAISHDELLRYRREGLRPADVGSDKR